MGELKLCPFCGSPAKLNSRSGDERNGYAETVTVGCTTCPAQISCTDHQPKRAPYYAKSGTGKTDAIAAWNRRHP